MTDIIMRPPSESQAPRNTASQVDVAKIGQGAAAAAASSTREQSESGAKRTDRGRRRSRKKKTASTTDSTPPSNPGTASATVTAKDGATSTAGPTRASSPSRGSAGATADVEKRSEVAPKKRARRARKTTRRTDSSSPGKPTAASTSDSDQVGESTERADLPDKAAGHKDAGPVDSGTLTTAEREKPATTPTAKPQTATSSGASLDGRRRRRRSPAKSVVSSGEKAAPEQSVESGRASTTNAEARRGGGSASSTDARLMLINVSAGDECRIAVVHAGRLEELFIERQSSQSHVGNIYKARVTNIEPSIQAAFLDFGRPQNGFLHISDLQPQYFPDHKGEWEEVGRKTPRHSRPPIQRCLRRGQEVIVQVTKEGVGTKGPTLTTYLSIPGRFLVMMPGMNLHGVSRKIEDETHRKSMRELLNQLDLPSGMGFILRTAGLGRTKRELQRDLNYLMRLWKTVADRIKRLSAPSELYRESDLVIRTIRDVYTADFERLVVDHPETARKAREFLEIAMPRAKTIVEEYTAREPMFHRYGIEQEIEKINMRHVPLPTGGSLVIDSTEAMVAIDVNSGRSRVADDAEEMAYKINMEAAEEVARQLRLRDLGGLILCDFIDMRLDRHKRAVERALRDALKKHKERARILRMSAFGIIEMTRQRQGPSLKRNIYYDCPHCKGSGLVKMPGSIVLDVMRVIQLATHNEQVRKVSVTVSMEVAHLLLNNRRAVIQRIESETKKSVAVRGDPSFLGDQVEYVCEDARGRPISLAASPNAPPSGA